MKFSILASFLYVAALVAATLTLDTTFLSSNTEISQRDPLYSSLEKRRGGGGGRGGGGTKGGSGTKGSGGSSGGGRPISSYSFSTHNNAGGRTRDGSGPPPPYSGRYAGGTYVPYTSGGRSPSGVIPYSRSIGFYPSFPGIWLYGSLWAYPYGFPYHYYHGGRNDTANVTCLCQRYSVCGCDPNRNSTFIQDVVNNGTNAPVNSSISVFITYANGTSAAFINGTLPNGTTAPGGTDPSNANEISAAVRTILNLGGYWVMAVAVSGIVLMN